MKNCSNCDKQTKNPRFCSRSCSNSYTNKTHPKRKLKKTCKKCTTKIKSGRTYCDSCWNVRETAEKICKKHGTSKFSHDGRTFRCSICNSERVADYRRRTKQKLVNMFGGKCQCCGYNKSLWALTFHHIDESKKEFAIGSGHIRAWSKVIDEIKKCIMICSNCHQEVHDGIRIVSHINPGPTTPST